MGKEKAKIGWVILVCAVCIALFFGYHLISDALARGKDHARVGFVLIGDESTPYSANFIRAM